MKIGVVYGHVASNLGDLAINHGTAAMLRRVAPDSSVHVVLLNLSDKQLPAAEAAFSGVENATFTVLRTRNNVPAGVSQGLAELALATHYVMEPARFIADAGLTGCDVVMYNSGEQLFAYQDHGNHTQLLWRVLPALAAKAAGMGFVTLPVTAGPFEAPLLAPMLRAFFSLSDGVAVRDAISARIASDFLDGPPPPVLLDPAFFMPAPVRTDRDVEPVLGLVMRLERFGLRFGSYYHTSKESRVYAQEGFRQSPSFQFAVAAAQSFLDHVGGKVKLFIQSGNADSDLTLAVNDALKQYGHGDRLQVVAPTCVTEYARELGTVSFIIASRFHACILGVAAGTPVMGVYFEEHGHKMPGLFELLGLSEYCQNLSQKSPQAAAESVVPLFHRSGEAFAGMNDRLDAMREETLGWLNHVLATSATVSPEAVEAAATAYVDGIEAVRRRIAPDVLPEMEKEALARKIVRLKSELAKERRTLQEFRESFSYQLGSMLVRAVRNPGFHTVLLPYHVSRLLIRKTGRRRVGKTPDEEASPGGKVRAEVIRRGKALLNSGRLGEWIALADRHTEIEYFRKLLPTVSGKYSLLEHGFQPASTVPPQSYQPRNDTVFYLLHNSLPYATGGYAIRTQGLLRGLTSAGWKMYGVTRPRFPFGVKEKRGLNVPGVSADESVPDVDDVDGVSYLRLLQPEDRSFAAPPDSSSYIQAYVERLLALCPKYRPALIHAASFFWNGIAAVNAARVLGLPSIYELRGLRDVARVSLKPQLASSDEQRLDVRMELDACAQATAVIAITQAVKSVLVERGIPREKILVVPNGVDSDSLVPVPRDRELEARLGYAGKKVIGYIGAFAQYEGLEYLLHAAAMLRSRGRDDFRVLLVGDGMKYDELHAMCDELHLRETVTMTGRVPHDEIQRYYSLVDVVPLPRKGMPVCEIVSPLKPFEAMAMGKTLVVSDVAALAEIVRDGETGLLHKKDDAQHLARTVETLLDNPDLTHSMGEAAREWVVANRDWRALARMVGDLYRELLDRNRG